MEGKMNSYGKTYHLWSVGKGHRLPLGDPMLAWSFNRDGEAQPGLVKRRDEAMDIDTAKIREKRRDLVKLAHPQVGVDVLKGKFSGPTQPIEGVVAADSSAAIQP